MNNKFVETMESEHDRILNTIELFFKNNEDISAFNQIIWDLERHMLIEEKETFVAYPIENIDDQLMVDRLMDDHKKIIKVLKSLKRDLEDKKKVDIIEFQDLWNKHHQFEDEHFYPKLEAVLRQSRQDEILKKLNTSI